MSIQLNHPAFSEEISRFHATLAAIEKTIAAIENKGAEIDGSWNDRAVALQLAEMDATMVKNLRISLKQPYFARIDVLEVKRAEQLNLYIGKTGFGHDDPTVQIIDWRAPIAELYYSSSGGLSSYAAPGGARRAEVLLKRKFDTQEGEILAIFDERIIDNIQKLAQKNKAGKKPRKKMATTDEFLNYKLAGHVDNRLKDIVATIQKEQNKIIRAGKDLVLIVQGAAGSGKTTIALHRLSYLIYHNQGTFASDRLLIIAPNRIFMDYISDVLPELGVDSVPQDTFEGLAARLLGVHYRTNDQEKLRFFHGQASAMFVETERENLLAVSKFKASVDFKTAIDLYLNYFREDFGKRLKDIVLPKSEFTLAASVLRTKLENRDQPLSSQLAKLKSFIVESVHRYLYGDQDFHQGRIAQLRESYRQKIDGMRSHLSGEAEINRVSQGMLLERDKLILQMEKEERDFLARYFNNWPELTVLDFYQEMLANPKVLKRLSKAKIDFNFLAEISAQIFAARQVEREDLAPLIYLKHLLFGLPEAGQYLHMIIDEAQDIGAFEYEVLKILSANKSMTIVGDLSQGIHYFRGIDDWAKLLGQLAPAKNQAYFELELSYRSTMEIIHFANAILQAAPENMPQAKPVIRNGSLPEVVKTRDMAEMMVQAADKIKWTLDRGYKSVAVLCKTMEQCQFFYDYLSSMTFKTEVNLITQDQTSYCRGISIVPVFLAKGLEFDAVIILDASAENYSLATNDLKLLYVAVTRALHYLAVFYSDELAPAIAGMANELYTLTAGDPELESDNDLAAAAGEDSPVKENAEIADKTNTADQTDDHPETDLTVDASLNSDQDVSRIAAMNRDTDVIRIAVKNTDAVENAAGNRNIDINLQDDGFLESEG